jgi:hypothetical protein
VVPLMLAKGAGAEMRQTLGTAVFSGMLGVTLFGIFLTPVFYCLLQGVSDWWASPKHEPLFAAGTGTPKSPFSLDEALSKSPLPLGEG